jgi:hypothetical protein
VQKAIKTGRIKTVDGKIDFDQADRDWESNSDHRRQHRKKQKQSSPAHGSIEVMPAETFLEAQRKHEWLKVQKEELELRRRRGELAEVREIETAWGSIVLASHDRLLILPGKLAARLAAISDVHECQTLLEKEIREALTLLTEYPPNAV